MVIPKRRSASRKANPSIVWRIDTWSVFLIFGVYVERRDDVGGVGVDMENRRQEGKEQWKGGGKEDVIVEVGVCIGDGVSGSMVVGVGMGGGGDGYGWWL